MSNSDPAQEAAKKILGDRKTIRHGFIVGQVAEIIRTAYAEQTVALRQGEEIVRSIINARTQGRESPKQPISPLDWCARARRALGEE